MSNPLTLLDNLQEVVPGNIWTTLTASVAVLLLSFVYRWAFPRRDPEAARNGGEVAAEVFAAHGVDTVFTLTGGHIASILVGAKARGMKVVDVRHEVTSVFAADAYARVTGVPGVAVVTAGPGVTNTLTALKTALMGQVPLVLIGGATAGLLKGRGSLQDIDQVSVVRPHVKWLAQVSRSKDLVPTLEKAFCMAQSGVPGPVFVELPIDLLYPEKLIRKEMGGFIPKAKGFVGTIISKFTAWYLGRYIALLYQGAYNQPAPVPMHVKTPAHSAGQVATVAKMIKAAKRPVVLVGSQAMISHTDPKELATALSSMGVPTYLSGAARGLLGASGAGIQFRHKRKDAFREADLILIAGVPVDFRLGYGTAIPRSAKYVSVNRSREDLTKNKAPQVAVLSDPATFLVDVARAVGTGVARPEWMKALKTREDARDDGINEMAKKPSDNGMYCNAVAVCKALEAEIDEDAMLIADGGDFVGTAAYTVHPRQPRGWLDPGPLGTLGCGGGYGVGAAAASKGKPIWLLYGDGAFGFSLAEMDTFVRHELPVLAVIGNDACWGQIARDQVTWFGDDTGCKLSYASYEKVAEGFGAAGFLVKDQKELVPALRAAKKAVASGRPAVVNILLGKSDFRKGSISV